MLQKFSSPLLGIITLMQTFLCLSSSHAVDAYPAKPIKLIVTFVPGGGADILGRYLAQALTTSLGKPVVVENKPGAGGLVGIQAGLSAPADGYTLTLVSSSYTVNPSLYKLKFDPVNDMTPVVQASKGPLLVVVNASQHIKNLAEFVQKAKTKPAQMTYASSGLGSALHLGAALFADQAGIQINHVPYKGGGAALNDLLANQIDIYFAATASALPLVQTGKLQALAVTGNKRIPALPDVPTIEEQGYKGYDVTLWYGIIGPKGMPQDVVERLNLEANSILAKKDTASRFEADGAIPSGGTALEFKNTIRREIEMWGKVVAKIGIVPE
jgi:tripartite-type tricarboxylate transporter receptor subunit TctC